VSRSNLATLLADAAERHPDRPALLHEGEWIDYAGLDARSARTAGLLRAHGVDVGDRVGIVLPNTPAFVAAYHGVLRLGAIAVPLNPLLRAPEIRLRLEHAGATAVVGEAAGSSGAVQLDPEAAAAADPLADFVDRDGADTAVMLYTSGTTGEAKRA